jgi:Ca2+-binding RTX toxin-like protein
MTTPHRILRFLGLGALIVAATTVPLQPPSPAAAQTVTCGDQPATIVAARPGRISGTAGPDVIVGTPGDDTIVARAGNDVICGGGGNDRIVAGGGDDTIVVTDAPAGGWSIDGGGGQDTLQVATGDDADAVRFSADGVQNAVLVQNIQAVTSSRGTFQRVEHALVRTFDGNDRVRTVGTDLLALRSIAVDLAAPGSIGFDLDTVTFEADGERTVRVVSDDLGTRFLGMGGLAITVSNGDGGDQIGVGLTGGPHLVDARGYDAASALVLTTGDLDDVVLGSPRTEFVSSGGGDDVVRVGRGGSRIDGGDGDDILVGGVDLDFFSGGAGDDIMIGRGGTFEVADGGPGTDVAVGIDSLVNVP